MPQFKLSELVRPARPSDKPLLSHLISHESHVHRHLDWRPTLEWLGSQSFWVVEKKSTVEAAFACPMDPPEVAWIRLFVASSNISPANAWSLLFPPAYHELKSQNNFVLTAIALQDWFANLLANNGFKHRQDIVVLEHPPTHKLKSMPDSPVRIRSYQIEDQNAVLKVDKLAFEPIWQFSLDALMRACKQAIYITVAEMDGQVIGYQLSTGGPLNAHLARLAVDPRYQHNRIGFRLVHDMLRYCHSSNITNITVNTQDDNKASLALYKYIGFQFTGERFPTYICEGKNQK